MKPLYIALIVIGCIIIVAVAVTVPLVLLLNKSSASVSPILTITPTATSIPPIPVPTLTPLPPPPPSPTKIFPQYSYMAAVNLDLPAITIYILDTFAEPPVFINPLNPIVAPGTTDVQTSYISPDEKFLYVLTEISLLVFDLANPKLPVYLLTLPFINFGIPNLVNAYDLVMTPDGSLMFICARGPPGGLLVLSGSTLSQITWIPASSDFYTFYGPQHMAMNSNGQILYVSNGNDGGPSLTSSTVAIFLIDNNTCTYHSSISVSNSRGGLTGLAIDPDSKFLYGVSFITPTAISKTDTTTLVTIDSAPLITGGSGLFMNFSATYIFTGDQGGDIQAFDITGSTPSFTTRLDYGAANSPMGVANDKYIFMTCGQSGCIYYARIDTNPLFQNVTKMMVFPGSRTISPRFSQLLIVK